MTVMPLTSGRTERAGHRVPTVVLAADPVSEAGVASQLRFRAEIDLLDGPRAGAVPAEVAVVVCEAVDAAALDAVRRARPARVVLVSSALDGPDVLAAVEAGVQGVVRRAEATSDHLVDAVSAAAKGDGMLPPDLLGRLLGQVGDPARRGAGGARGLTYGGLNQRELDVLRLLADGYSTAEIARQLAYSERTIKNAIHDLTTRLQLRNRVHAVAFAVRHGLI